MSAPFAPGGRKGGRTGLFGGGGGGRGKYQGAGAGGTPRGDGFYAREGPKYDLGSHSTYFVAPTALPGGRSAAQLLDAEGFQLDRGGGSKEERLRKRLAEREREEEIARKLGEGGDGAGSEYLRVRGREGLEEKVGMRGGGIGEDAVDAASLGLKRNRAGEVLLSPIKRRRVGLGEVAGVGGSERKKTRFVTERGIRVAGRESLGGEEVVGRGGAEEDDDEDGLDVV